MKVYAIKSGSKVLYVGATRQSLKERWRPADRLAEFGLEPATLHLLQECTSEQEAWEAEQLWIAILRPRYNISIGGKGGATGVSPGFETRKKLSAGKIGVVAPATARAKMSVAKKGKPLSEEHKARLKEAILRSMTTEVRRRISEAGKNQTWSLERRLANAERAKRQHQLGLFRKKD